MNNWQQIILGSYGCYALLVFFKGYLETKIKKKVFHESWWIIPTGSFVWGDAIIFGLFWSIVSLVCLLLKDWLLFGLTQSVFWTIRSLGETTYWFNQQFSTLERNPPHKMKLYELYQNDSVWFAYQIVWQCVAVVSIILSIYLGNSWLKTL